MNDELNDRMGIIEYPKKRTGTKKWEAPHLHIGSPSTNPSPEHKISVYDKNGIDIVNLRAEMLGLHIEFKGMTKTSLRDLLITAHAKWPLDLKLMMNCSHVELHGFIETLVESMEVN